MAERTGKERRRKSRGLVLIAVIGHAKNDIFVFNKAKHDALHSCIFSNLLFVSLKKELEAHGYRVATIDMHDMSEADHIVFLDAWPYEPHFREFKRRRKTLRARSSLVLIEPPITNAFNHKRSTHALFDRVLTFDPTADKKRYFRYHYPANVAARQKFKVPFAKKRFLCVTGGNKYSVHEHELYSERKRATIFFAAKREGIDSYGPGWNKRQPLLAPLKHMLYRSGTCLRHLMKGNLKPFQYIWEVTFNTKPIPEKAMRGWSDLSIVQLYSGYKFALCFENGTNIPGYASERLYDCMNARCVPIYLGDTEILKQVPPGCYIDMRKFTTYERLYRYLLSIDEKRYKRYIANIDAYLRSAEGKPYSITHFCKEFYHGLIAN